MLYQAWLDFGLAGIFDFVQNAGAAGLLKAMVLGRVLFPSAKLALVDHAAAAPGGGLWTGSGRGGL